MLFAAIFSIVAVAQIAPPAASAAELQRAARGAAASRQWDQAAATYRDAIALAPRDVQLRFELGATLQAAGQLPAAIEALHDALSISPHNEAALLALAECYRQAFNYDQARRAMGTAQRAHPRSSAPLLALGELDIQERAYQQAITHLQRAAVLAPADVKVRNDLAVAFKERGNPDAALKQLSVALAHDPRSALAWYLRGQIHAARNQNDQALADAEKVFALQPNNDRGRLLLAQAAVHTGKCAHAAEVLEPLATASSENSEALYLLWQAQQCLGDKDAAQQTLDRFTAASKKEHAANEDRVQSGHLVDQAGEAARHNQLVPALDLLQQALDKDPQNGNAWSQLAKIHYSAGKIAEAHEAINRALKINPYKPDYLYVLGRILQAENKPAEALQTFQELVQVNPTESDAYYEMSVIYQQQSDRPHALAALQKAVALSPADPDYKKALAALTSAKASPPQPE
jgi:tetratricopeptide (TPR) repeat protein